MPLVQGSPEPMNASPHHAKVRLTTMLSDPLYVAGTHVSGKLEMECRADKGLGIGVIMVELFAVQELTSRDHSATTTFLHSRRLFQGPGLPPSNAVLVHPAPGTPPLPREYFHARKGRSIFLFQIPLPSTCPSTISFASGLAKVRYELRASVAVIHKNERRLVVEKRGVDVIGSFPFEEVYLSLGMGKLPEGIVVGEGGKLWMQGRLTAPLLIGGETACLEIQVKNHSNKKNSSLTLALTRTLYLPGSTDASSRPPPVQFSDTLLSVPYRGPEYVIMPGVEGIANLVFDVPRNARVVRGGTLDGDEEEGGEGMINRPRQTESLFEIRCKIEVRLTLGMGSKDIILEIPVEVAHPSSVPPDLPFSIPGTAYAGPEVPAQQPLPPPTQYTDYGGYYPPTSAPYLDQMQQQVWLPPPPNQPYIPNHYAPSYNMPQPLQPYHTGPQHMISPPPNQMAGHPVQSIVQPPQQLPMSSYANLPPSGHPQQHPHLSMHIQSQAMMDISGLPPQPSGDMSMGMVGGMPPSLDMASAAMQYHNGAIDGYHSAYDHGAAYTEDAYGYESANTPPLSAPIAAPVQSMIPPAAPLLLPTRTRTAIPVPPPTVPSLAFAPQPVPLPVTGGVIAAPPPPPRLPRAISSGPLREPEQYQTNGVDLDRPVPLTLPLHSPRPQLSPRQSAANLGSAGQAQSERVEQLERMVKQEDVAKDKVAVLDVKQEGRRSGEESEAVDINKTLPGPPVPSVKPIRSNALRKVKDKDKKEKGKEAGKEMEKEPRTMLSISAGLLAPLSGASSRSGSRSGSISASAKSRSRPASPLPSEPPSPSPVSAPAPSKRLVQTQPARPRADVLFALGPQEKEKNKEREEKSDKPPGGLERSSEPLPPPLSKNFLSGFAFEKPSTSLHLEPTKTESGLDALERRLLAEVGTRKVDKDLLPLTRALKEEGKEEQRKAKAEKEKKELSISVNGHHAFSPAPAAGISTPTASSQPPPSSLSPSPSPASGHPPLPIPMPMKSPELPTNDSAISSLTLAGGLTGFDDVPPDAAPRSPMLGVTPVSNPIVNRSTSDLGLDAEQRRRGLSPPASDRRVGRRRRDRDDEDLDDPDFDGRTHKAGRSRSRSFSARGKDGEGSVFNMSMSMGDAGGDVASESNPRKNAAGHSRQEADGGGGGTPTKTRSRVEKERERTTSLPKKQKENRRHHKTVDAQGRVAEWLGAIDPAVPPQEEVIPPSPSVVRDLPPSSPGKGLFEPLEGIEDGSDDEDGAVVEKKDNDKDPFVETVNPTNTSSLLSARAKTPTATAPPAVPGVVGHLSSYIPGYGFTDPPSRLASPLPSPTRDRSPEPPNQPNPRSSGFVPIETLKRDSLILSRTLTGDGAVVALDAKPDDKEREATVLMEARKVQELWREGIRKWDVSETTPTVSAFVQSRFRTSGDTGMPPWVQPKMQFVATALDRDIKSKPMSIHTHRRVSPPSSRPTPSEGLGKLDTRPFARNPLLPQRSDQEKRLGSKPSPTTAPKPMSYSAAAKNVWRTPSYRQRVPSGPQTPSTTAPTPTTTQARVPTPERGRKAPPTVPPKPPPKPVVSYPPPKVVDIDAPKYDVRSARGGRGGKVTSVASLWASGAIQNQSESEKEKSGAAKKVGQTEIGGMADLKKRAAGTSADVVSSQEKKSFSAALIGPAPKSQSRPSSAAENPITAQVERRQERREVVGASSTTATESGPTSTPSSAAASRALSPLPTLPPGVTAPKRNRSAINLNLISSPGLLGSAKSTEGSTPPLVRSGSTSPLPASLSTSSNPFAVNRPASIVRTSSFSKPGRLSTPGVISHTSSSPASGSTSSQQGPPKPPLMLMNRAGAGGVNLKKPGVIPSKSTADAAIVSSHATPTLSSSASLARPRTNSRPMQVRSQQGGGGVSELGVHVNGSSEGPVGSGSPAGGRAKADFESKALPSSVSGSGTAGAGVGGIQSKAGGRLGVLLGSGGKPVTAAGEPSATRSSSPSKTPDLAFGQARLRDLIKKYQG